MHGLWGFSTLGCPAATSNQGIKASRQHSAQSTFRSNAKCCPKPGLAPPRCGRHILMQVAHPNPGTTLLFD